MLNSCTFHERITAGALNGATDMQDVKMTDHILGINNDLPSKSQGVKMQDTKMQD